MMALRDVEILNVKSTYDRSFTRFEVMLKGQVHVTTCIDLKSGKWLRHEIDDINCCSFLI